MTPGSTATGSCARAVAEADSRRPTTLVAAMPRQLNSINFGGF
jgi:hypothetical protein